MNIYLLPIVPILVVAIYFYINCLFKQFIKIVESLKKCVSNLETEINDCKQLIKAQSANANILNERFNNILIKNETNNNHGNTQ